MKQIFEAETEIGKWEGEDFVPGTSPWSIYVHTLAVLSRGQDLVKVEQRCYLRRDVEIEGQGWVEPELLLETASGGVEGAKRLAGRLHRGYVERARRLCPAHALMEV
jgi:hypothetical protein